ncbi:MAG: YlqD family protein [Selenomonadales bacterium]|nr:YlqD family protein [Selenomonadales bacterium]MBQ6712570.1 YlqD family protein [Selenomonadales bacterium]
MDRMTLKCPVTIKAKVTDELKRKMIAEIQDGIKKVDLEIQQVEFQGKRMLTEQAKVDAQGLPALRQQIDMERQKRLDFKNHLLQQLKETEAIENGSEVVQGKLERLVEIKVGDDMQSIMNAEILLEDGKIVAFRN